jgi:hypothetical protein
MVFVVYGKVHTRTRIAHSHSHSLSRSIVSLVDDAGSSAVVLRVTMGSAVQLSVYDAIKASLPLHGLALWLASSLVTGAVVAVAMNPFVILSPTSTLYLYSLPLLSSSTLPLLCAVFLVFADALQGRDDYANVQ